MVIFAFISRKRFLNKNMKHFLLAVCGFFAFSAISAQTIVYHETFDPADSVTATGNPAWLPDATLQVSGLLSYKNTVALNDTSWLTTDAFSTTGNFFVLLNFSHICKIDMFDKAQVQVSSDNGVTWNTLGSAEYQGTGLLVAGNSFNSTSYSTTWQPGNNSASPANSWWMNETFDASAYLANSAQCKVRFKLFDTNGNGAFSNYGWVLDDVIVTAAPSELNPPVITLLNPIYSGTVYSLGPFAVNASITDASGISLAEVHYTVNGGPVQTVTMSNVSGNDWLGTIPAVSDSDTICYFVYAEDASPSNNSAQAPTPGCQQFITSAGITFPYFDDFEGDTLWTVVTPQPGSPPSQWELGMPAYGATNSTHSGNNCWDVNLASAYGNNVRTAIVSPVFDFSNAVNARLSFWHNYNAENGWDGVRLDYTTDGVTWNTLGTQNDPNGVNWYTGIMNSTGTDGWNGTSGGWIKSEYDLAILNNVVGPVQFRFLFASDASVTTDGYSIDDFAIVLPSPQDANAVAMISPDVSSCLPQGSVNVCISFKNVGTQNIVGPMDITYVLDNGTPVTEQYMGTLVPAASDTFCFATPLVNTAGAHTLKIYTGLTNDGFVFNDTINVSYTTSPGVAVPYFNDFESGVGSLTDFCVNTGTYGRVQVLPQGAFAGNGGAIFDASSSLGWTNFSTDTFVASPNYVWQPNVNAMNKANARLIVNTNGYNNLVMEFYAKVLYQYANDYTNFRVRVNGTMVSPHMQPNFVSTPYNYNRYDLTPFLPAPYLIIDFESKTAYDYVTGNGTFLDNLYIYEPDTIDAGVYAFTAPGPMSPAGTNVSVSVNIRNYGMTTLTSMPVSYSVNNGPPVTETWNGSLAPNATTTFNFSTQYAAPTGQYSVCAWTSAVNDGNAGNDTSCTGSTGLPTLQAPFIDDLEGNVNFAVGQTLTSPSWQLGTPLAPNITGAHSGTNAWEVNLGGTYQLGANDVLYSPFVSFVGVQQAELRFWSWMHAQNFYDGGRVDYSTDGGNTWQILGNVNDPNGTNWYNYASLFSSNQPGWMGLNGSYIQCAYKLTMFNNYPTPVQFRFVFSSATFSIPNDGWGIDDFEIWVPINAATNTITLGTPNTLPVPGNNTVTARVKNSGQIALNSVDVTLNIDGNTIVTDNLTFSPALNPAQTITHTFSQQWLNAAPGNHIIKVWTSNPNAMNDTYLPDDTTTWNITVFDTVSVYPYCNDFENGNGRNPLAGMNAFRYTPDQNSFKLGAPGKNIITAAHSGTNCWITEIGNNYLANDSSGLFSPVFDVQTNACYFLSFYHNYMTPMNQDGGVVEYSTDLGLTWQVLGAQFDPLWYNVTSVQGLGAGTDGFSGNSNYWVWTSHPVSFNQNGNVVFRFRFGSDGSIQSEGWAIDDLCFDEWLSPCVSSVDELSSGGLQLGDNQPNPASGLTMVPYFLPENGKVTLTLRDVLGREVRSFSGDQAQGLQQWNLNVAELPSGVYYYSLQFGDQQLMKRMVISR